MTSNGTALATLQRHWGYSSFRPLQERIINSLVGGHDVCVVMPTGGGKSLCYQLPAAMQASQTVIVISPLIALMQDQISQLTQMGIAAASLNSSLPSTQQFKIMRGATEGAFRLLYLGPERLAREDTVDWLKRVPIGFFAIDEAHCISEWGHEFRPEYRQLSALRQHFPDRPIAAFTASATRRVRHDIVDQLRLRNPDRYIASFHRPNLRYVVKECDGLTQNDLLMRALKHHAGQSVIIYVPTIKLVERAVDSLEEQGIAAIPYHGQMDAETRRRNQERWTSDEARVIVGTIAFGLGINKASVRAVIHLSLPKSIEQYYQEAGRAGRDGQAADCLMLWQKHDIGLLTYFINQMTDAAEKERSWQRYHEIRRFVELSRCRHFQICSHFGETPKWQACGACDVCGAALEWLQATVQIPKHHKATTTCYGEATELPVVERNEELADYLREWRRNTARDSGVPAFVVMHDSTLDALCRRIPRTLADIRRISGFGERKTQTYGQSVLNALRQFEQGERATPEAKKNSRPAEETRRLLMQGHTIEEVATIRGRKIQSVIELMTEMIEGGQLEFQSSWIAADKLAKIEAACAGQAGDRLRPIKDALPPEITYEEIRLVLAHRRAKQKGTTESGDPVIG